MNLLGSLTWIALAQLAPTAGTPEMLAVRFIDPFGDSTSDIDIAQMSMYFDDTTGAYSIQLYTTAAGPFLGTFRINVSLYNGDTGSTSCAIAFLPDTVNDFDEATPKRRLSFGGTSATLTNWQIGDRVTTNDVPFGTPDCNNGFSSEVRDLPLEPYFGDGIATGNYFVEIYLAPFFEDGFETGDTVAWSLAVP
jgi:hypothetical protein